MTDIKKKIRSILDLVAREGTYSEAHINVLLGIAYGERAQLQEELKALLNINDCHD